MNESATSLERLHDIVTPAPVPFWPPAPGWYVMLALALAGLAALGYRSWKTWKANAYRREARRELAAADDVAQIGALLRRVALAVAPRSVVAAQTGTDWPAWLAGRCSDPMPDVVRDQLAFGVYRQPPTDVELHALKSYAENWIAHHQRETAATGQNSTSASG